MSLAIQGSGVSSGIAIGPVRILRRNSVEILKYNIPAALIDEEIARYESALAQASQQLRDLRNNIPANTPDDITDFIDTHLLMLQDSTLSSAPLDIIRQAQCNAEWALKQQQDALVRVFEEMDNDYLRTRRDDIDHVVNGIQHLLQASAATQEPHNTPASRLRDHILIADDLSPADTVLMQHQGIAAFVTEGGGPTSHTAILARSLRIPAIVGMHHIRDYLVDGEVIVVDGSRGWLLANIDEDCLQFYRQRRQEDAQRIRAYLQTRDEPAVTRDNTTITLNANIELPDDITAVHDMGAQGVGLYRTEFLFMNRSQPPDEQEQYEIYREVLDKLAGKPLTIRTLDLGADKQVDGGRDGANISTNPALGLRAIRLCLKEPELFLPQLRAILRASACGPVRMMLPMLSTTQELQQVLRLIKHTQEQLKLYKLDFNPHLPVGVMIEVPSAAIMAHMFTPHVDFLSIGTNDLIQYTLAIDRIDDEVNYLYDPINPAVIHLIASVLRAGAQSRTPVTMCGEMAGDPDYTRLLLGMGLTEFSMHPNALPQVKHLVSHSHIPDLQATVEQLLQCQDHETYSRLLEQL
ncbi:MAG: phosphoenolpyruvate--protein phosphotransferase [Gammaproteobacteria bacterium]